MKLINYILFVSVFSAFGFAAIIYIVWHDSDPDDRKSIETDILLFKHALIDQSSELKILIEQYQGEAINSAAVKKLINWGLSNQQEFLNIISSSSEPEESAAISEKIAYAIYHGGSKFVSKFKDAYKNFNSKELTEIISFLDKLEKAQFDTITNESGHK